MYLLWSQAANLKLHYECTCQASDYYQDFVYYTMVSFEH